MGNPSADEHSTSNGGSSSREEGTAHRNHSQLSATVPQGAIPGKTQVSVATGRGTKLLVTVPALARPGDELLFEPALSGSWECKVMRQPDGVAPREATSSRAPGADGVPRHRIRVVVPENVEPGVTKMRVDINNKSDLLVTIPETSRPGDELILEEGEQGDWTWVAAPQEGSEFTFEVPQNALPGVTKLNLDTGLPGSKPGLVTVPRTARPGDRLRLSLDEAGVWQVQVVRAGSNTVEPAGGGATMTVYSAPPSSHGTKVVMTTVVDDPEETFRSLVAAAVAAGGVVSPKIARGCAPPLNLMGIVAREPIEDGELLVRMPSHTNISRKMCEKVKPELFAAMKDLVAKGLVSEGREPEITHCAMLSLFLQDAEARLKGAAATRASGGTPVDDRPEPEGLHAQSVQLWDKYAESLLALKLDGHPYFRSLTDSCVRARYEPSQECSYLEMMSGDTLGVANMLLDRVDPRELLGRGFDVGPFLQARLCITTRQFSTAHGSALVPVADGFNHSHNPSALWSWDFEHDAHVVRARRAHAAGEEVLISYGARSNVLFFRTYGFTLCPSTEPSWCFVVHANRPPYVQRVFDEYLGAGRPPAHVIFDTKTMDESSANLLNNVSMAERNPEEFLGELCRVVLAEYEQSERLRPALDALRRARLKDVTSAAWWDELRDGDVLRVEDMYPDWTQDLLRVQMSEYLCVLAHREAADVEAGRMEEGVCLAGGTTLRGVLQGAFAILRRGNLFSLVLKPAGAQ